MNVTKERMEPESGPDMVNHDDFIMKNESEGFKHHSKDYGKHSQGYDLHHENVKKLCKGGMR